MNQKKYQNKFTQNLNVIAVSGNTEFTDLQPNAQDEIDHFTGGHYYVVKVIERVGYHGN